MNEDFSQSDWCDFYDGINQSEEDDLNYDYMQLLIHEMETSEDKDTMKNEKIKWIEDSDHKNVEMLFNGANDLIWKQASEEISNCVDRLPEVLGKSHSQIAGNELSSLFEFFMNEHSSLVQIVCSTCKISC